MEYSTYLNGATAEMSFDMNLQEDYLAIRWMQENIQGSPVIVEANTVEYQWGNRFTIYTGLPGVVGWNWHQRQQRGVVTDQWVWDRVKAITGFYQTLDVNEARAFLRKYNVRYIVVGQLEHAYYWQEGLDKFDAMVRSGELKVVYASGHTVIYEVVDLGT